jgi:hypothetical protein
MAEGGNQNHDIPRRQNCWWHLLLSSAPTFCLGRCWIWLQVRDKTASICPPGLDVTCCDLSQQALHRAGVRAKEQGAVIRTWQVDLEQPEVNPPP